MLKPLKIDVILHMDDKKRMLEYRSYILNRKVTFADCWYLYDLDGEKLYGEEIKKSFQLLPSCYENDSTYRTLIQFKTEGYVLIGVHIRRGDYKEFGAGRWYYADDVYEKYMDQMRRLLPDVPKKFIIFTADKTSISGDDVFVSHAPWYVDLHCLGECDYTFGPPSTFRGWACFISNNRTWGISDSQENISDLSIFRQYQCCEEIMLEYEPR